MRYGRLPLAFLLLICLLTGSVCLAEGTISFDRKNGSVNGGFSYDVQLTSTEAPARDTEILLADEAGNQYPLIWKAGEKTAVLPIATQQKENSEKLVLSFVSTGELMTKGNPTFSLSVLPLPKVTFYNRLNIGKTGKKWNVQVSASSSTLILPGNNVFQLRDHTGAVLAEKTWKNPGEKLIFQIDAGPELVGRHDLSVWLGDYCLSSEEFGTVYDPTVKAIKKVETNEPYMAITIDCNWYNMNGEAILDVLDKYGVKATFFMTGNYMRLFPDTVKRIIASGHQIGNHTNTHSRQSELGEYTQMKEIMIPCKLAFDTFGVQPRLFRPPYGDFNNVTVAVARGMGMEMCLWTIDSHDWDLKFQQSPEKILARVKKNVTPGTIILFHMDGYGTAGILDEAIPYYQNELGLNCVTMNKLLALEGRELPPLPESVYALAEGDTPEGLASMHGE